MKKYLVVACAMLITASANAAPTNTPAMSFGVDISQPYALTVDGNSVNKRANLSMGLDYRYFTTDNLNVGLRYAMDVEKQAGSTRNMNLAPGVQYHWFQGQTWMPYVRADLPVTLHGAASSTGSTSQKDMGVAAGGGLAWNLGDQIGIENFLLRYDFTASYMLGLGNALNTFSIEFFKIGMDYRF